MIELDGKSALVTGGSRGIGAACCKLLARAGARVAVNYRVERPRAELLVQRIKEAGGALQRLSWANEIHPAMAIFEGRPKVARWWIALAARDSVRGSAVPDLRERFDKMIGRDRGGYRSVVGARIA